MKFSFFDWIREGVKQSVLLGVSDAAVHLGSEKEVDELNQRLLDAMQANRLQGSNTSTRSAGNKGRKARRALGRTLAETFEEREVHV
jgi:hypothetical protein